MIQTAFEILATVRKAHLEYLIAKHIRTLQMTYLQSDNLHHKYDVETRYPQDLIELGRIAEQLEIGSVK